MDLSDPAADVHLQTVTLLMLLLHVRKRFMLITYSIVAIRSRAGDLNVNMKHVPIDIIRFVRSFVSFYSTFCTVCTFCINKRVRR